MLKAAVCEVLPGFTNIVTDVRRGITHTEIRILGDSKRARKLGFLVDVYVNRRTQDFSVARIDNKDEATLYKIVQVLKQFEF
jgi:ribosomal protein L13E